MFGVGSARYDGFFSRPGAAQPVHRQRVPASCVAVGMTFVILTGGIDLSVGSVVALSGDARGEARWPRGGSAVAVLLVVLLVGASLGLAMGCVIHYFEIQPFIVTLAGHVPRPRALLRDQRRVDPDPRPAVHRRSPRAPCRCPATRSSARSAWSRSLVVAGRRVRAARHPVRPHGVRRRRQPAVGRADGPAGGPHQGRRLRASAGFCSALGGLLLRLLHRSPATACSAVGMELDAIAAVVIGGTLLTGGVGLRGRLGARRAGPRPDPDAHHRSRARSARGGPGS